MNTKQLRQKILDLYFRNLGTFRFVQFGIVEFRDRAWVHHVTSLDHAGVFGWDRHFFNISQGSRKAEATSGRNPFRRAFFS